MDLRQHREQAQVLHPEQARERIDVGRADPPSDLAWCLDYLWWVRWDVASVHIQRVIPRPVVHVCAEVWDGEARLLVNGVSTELFERKLEGVGRTVAAAFRPGGFRPFIGVEVSALVNRVVPAEDVFAVDDRPIAARLLDREIGDEDAADELAAWLRSLEPRPDPIVQRVAALVELAEADAAIVRASQLAENVGVSNRTLQRWFRSYVGVSPKWVVQRHRLLDVAAAANAADEVDWALLAADLGFSDQSHLIRQFRTVVGESPARYFKQRDAG